MSRLTLADVPDRATAAAGRPALEREVIAAKRLRRLDVGPHMTLLFENRLTCLWQVLEMVRVEQITDPTAIQHELDTYNALLPGPSELSATLLIGVQDPDERARLLAQLVGLHEHLSLTLGDQPPIAVRFDDEQYNTERISSVQFLRVPLPPAARRALGELSLPARLRCTHPAYTLDVPLPLTLRAVLLEDLAAAGEEAP